MEQAAANSDDVPIKLEYRPLREDRPLGLLEDACLPLRAPRYATCRACEIVCPVKAIHIGETALQLDESCVRCGRCAAACPMGALALPGFSVADVPQEKNTPLSIDCWKVPKKFSPEGSVRVPCLGGLSTGRILELVTMAGAHPLELLDRGWCSKCSAGSSTNHPTQANLEQAVALLEAAGLATDQMPILLSVHLPVSLLPIDIPEPVTETGMSRRAFFSALTSKAVTTIDKVKPLASALEARQRRGFEREPVPSRERERLLRGVELICKSAGVTPPHKLFFRVAISDACSNHQLCASTCPTGALAVFEQGGRAEIIFDTRLCIGCNECHSICPSGALNVLPNGYDVLPEHPIHLTSFTESFCIECGQAYTEKNDENFCQQCRKHRQLASSAFQSLFGSRR